MKYSKTAIAVVLFIIVLFGAMYSEKAKAEGYIGLGKSTFNSHSMTGEIGYRNENNWDIGFQLVGPGETKNGNQTEVYITSLSHIIKPGWLWSSYFMRLGAGYVHDSNLIGDLNFKLGIGFDFGPFEVEMVHFSSAGIWSPNSGYDAVMLRAKF